eukprot:TRINITY_DN43130_c0_g1_i1.p1 TRINITY_DN43130_c0_g1~~TRINITY_DN43130_c0_g1_i1.p1  ORF type:complete len:719 (+),score=127.41 TRINITY_DN43130_c0_g1_i1:155-2158(+)
MRTISPRCAGLNNSELMHFVEDLHTSGVKAIAVNAAYDSGSGYPLSGPSGPLCLWCGLALNDFMEVSPDIGTREDWMRLADSVHAKGMALVTWMNPSYFWTGSKHFKQAERDIQTYSLEGLPPESPARWFKWKPNCSNVTVVKPRDDAPRERNGQIGWVCDDEVGAAYLSIFADQPSADFGSSAWQKQLKAILEHWILEMKVDGFVFDWPDGYFSAGITSQGFWAYDKAEHLIKRSVTDVVREASGGRAASMAELYGYPDRAMDYGLDTSLDSRGDFTRSDLVVQAIQVGPASHAEGSFTGKGGADETVQLCYRNGWCAVQKQRQPVMLSWIPGADTDGPGWHFNGYKCPAGTASQHQNSSLKHCFQECEQTSWCASVSVHYASDISTRDEDRLECALHRSTTVDHCERDWSGAYAHFARDAPNRLVLLTAVAVAGGYMAAIEQSSDSQWWSSRPYPGSESPALKSLHRAVESCPAFSHVALRSQLEVTQPEQHYALFRYDAQEDGAAALALFNFQAQRTTVEVHLPAGLVMAARGQVPIDCSTAQAGQLLTNVYSVELEPLSFKLLGHLKLPRWQKLRKQGGKEVVCIQGQGAASQQTLGQVSLSDCFLTCMMPQDEVGCEGVTVRWLDEGLVECSLLGGLETEHCADAPGDGQQGFENSTFVYSS